tara:strand:+ start:178 stop:474 length:297 start_codon:yes stop_codon:yes gene_type:complete
MNLTELATKPQLTKITIDSDVIVEKYGEAVDFYVFDRLPLDKYTQLASVKTEDFSSMIDLVKELILDQDGQPVMDDDHVLPTDLLNEAMVKVVESVGK